MTAFVNGAISALNRVLKLIDILDPKGEDKNLWDMKNQVLIYIEMYKSIEKYNQEHPIKDETWEKIEKASTLNEEDKENLRKVKKILYDA